MPSHKDSSHEAIDRQLDRLLSHQPVEASSDFLARLHAQLASEDATAAKTWATRPDQLDERIDRLLAKQTAAADARFLSNLRKRLSEVETEGTALGKRSIPFQLPRWAIAAVAVFALGLATWTQVSRDSTHPSEHIASEAASTEINIGNAHTYDPEITQILALAQNLDPNQELRSLDADRLQSFLLSSY